MVFKLKASAVLSLAILAAITGCNDKDNSASGQYGKRATSNDVVQISDSNRAASGNPAFHPSINLQSEITVNEGAGFSVQSGVSQAADYEWTQLSGPSLAITQSGNQLSLNLNAPKVTEDTKAVLRLTARNRYGVSSEDIVVNINNVPVPPTAKIDAGNRVVYEGSTVGLNGSATVVSGEPAATDYQWRQVRGPALNLQNTSGANLSFQAPQVNQDTEFEFVFVATGEISSQPVNIVVTVLNQTPVAEAGTVIEVLEGEAFTLDGADSQPNSDKPISEYSWKSVDGAYSESDQAGESPMVNLIAKGVDANKEYQFSLTVSNGMDVSAADTVTVRVLDGGDRPTAIANDVSVPQNAAVELSAAPSTEPKNRPLTFLWSQVVADGEAPVAFTVAENGQKINFVAPSVDDDKTLTFTVTAFNGFNYSNAETVSVTVIGQEIYSGDVVKLKGNPYTVLGDRLNLGVTAYSLEVVGTNAYVTYHETKKNDADVQPTGLLVIDISNEKEPKVVKDYPLAWAGEENITTVQMRLAVDAEQKYAYIAEKHLAGSEDAGAVGIVRIELASDPVEGNNGIQLSKAEEDNDGDQFSDIVIRGGALYGLEYTDTGAMYRITENAESGETEFTQVWLADEGKTDDIMGTLDMSEDGRVAVIMDLHDITVVHFDENGAVTNSFEVDARQMDSGRQGSRHIAVDTSGEYVMASFQSEITGTNVQPANRYSAVEKIDIRDVADDQRLPNERFSTPEQARGIVTDAGMTFVASGQQGLQLLDSSTADNLHLKTYYQTPMRAVDVAVNLEAKRVYTVGDRSFSITDLSSQDTPAMATNWVEDYYGFVQGGDNQMFPLGASDVELVTIPDDGMRAVVAQARDRSRSSSNLLIIDDFASDELTFETVDYSSAYKGRNSVRLTEYQGDVYTLYNETGGGGVHRLSNADIATGAPTLEKVAKRNTSGITFLDNQTAYLSQDADFWSWSFEDGKEMRGFLRLFNVYFYAQDLSAGGSRVLGAGMYNSQGEGCWLIDTNGENNNFSRLFYSAPESTLVQASAITNGANTCFAGFGYDSNIQKPSDRDEYRAEHPFGILSVDFKIPVDLIDADPSKADEKWEDSIDLDSVARQAIYDLPDNPEEIITMGHRLYVANSTFGGVQILDASNPTNLVLEGVLHTEDRALGLDVSKDQSLVLVADDNMRGIVQIPIEFPWLDRTDNDAETALVQADEELSDAQKEKTIARMDSHAYESEVVTFHVDWTREEYNQVTCYATNDTQRWGNETCTVTPVEGEATAATLTWTLPAGDVDQEIRVAVGNNIEFLSTKFQMFVGSLPDDVTP